MLLSSRRRISRETVELIRELLDEENRLREELGIGPARPVTFAGHPLAGDEVGRVDPHPARVERRADHLRRVDPHASDDELH